MFPNLNAEMARKDIDLYDLATLLDLHYNTVRLKITGERKFSLEEIFKIKNKYFKNKQIEYLFKTKD